MNLKQNIHSACIAFLEEKIRSMQKQLAELSEGAAGEGKSSAGDKHETGRAMAQLEQEKIGKQVLESERQKTILQRNPGTLIKTNGNFIFVAVALGKISVGENSVMVISPQSPLGAKLAGVKAGESISVNGTVYRIEEVS